MSNERVPQKRLPATLADVTALSAVFDPKRPLPPADDDYYLQISEEEDFTPAQFNARANQVTRHVTITGIRQIWDGKSKKLMTFAHSDANEVSNLRQLTIVADEVIIRTRLWFPRTNVILHARVLRFEGSGAIHTTPKSNPIKQAGIAPANDPAPGYVAKDGLAGESAGDIELYVHRIEEDKADPNTPRFVARGTDGQAAEPGGYFALKFTDEQSAEIMTKDVPVVKASSVQAKVNRFAAKKWRWPGEVATVAAMAGKDEKGAALVAGQVVHLRLFAVDTGAVTANITLTTFPGAKINSYSPPGIFVASPIAAGVIAGELQAREEELEAKEVRPRDGRDAYPGGAPGRGGNGGNVTWSFGKTLRPGMTSLSAGKPGASTAAIQSDPPGNPNPAYWMSLMIVKRDLVESSITPKVLRMVDVSGKPGAKADGRTACGGDEGRVEVVWRANPNSLRIHPDALAAVLRYARDAFRLGHRERAWEVLKPYDELPIQAVDNASELASHRIAITALHHNLQNNLDFFGNPPGWVPRLNVTTTFTLFQKQQTLSSQLLHTSGRMIDNWKKLDRAAAVAMHQSSLIAQESEMVEAALTDAFAMVGPVREAFRTIASDLALLEKEFVDVQKQALEEAKSNLRMRNIVSGCFKVLGGLAKAIPVCQPYLGMAGDVVSSLGDLAVFDAQGEISGDVVLQSLGKFGEDLGEKVDGYLKKHQSFVTKERDEGLARSMRDATAAINTVENNAANTRKMLEAAWDEPRQAEVERLRAEVANAQSRIADLNRQGADAVIIAAVNAEGVDAEDRARRLEAMGWERALVELRAELANEQAASDDGAKRHQAAVKRMLAEFEGRKDKLTSDKAELKTDHEIQEKTTKRVMEQLSGVGDGISAIGGGIRRISMVVDDDDPTVQALLANIDTSPIFSEDTRTRFSKLKDDISGMNDKKILAAASLTQSMQRISEGSAHLASNLEERMALARQIQRSAIALAPSTLVYLESVRQRAKERIQAALYEFVQAYRYHYLQDVTDALFSAERLIQEIQKLQGASVDGALTETQLRDAENLVFQNEYLELAANIVRLRAQTAATKSNTYECMLKPAQLEQLARTGQVTFNLVADMEKRDFVTPMARIVSISMEEKGLNVDTDAGDLSLDVVFTHSGISIVRDKDGHYWGFRPGTKEKPIAWGFVYNHLKGKIIADAALTDVLAVDEFLESKLTGSQTVFREYWPSLFSDITLTINRGRPNPVSRIKAIEKLVFTVKDARAE